MLVVEVLGGRSRSDASCVTMDGESQDEPYESWPSRKEAVVPLTRAAVETRRKGAQASRKVKPDGARGETSERKLEGS